MKKKTNFQSILFMGICIGFLFSCDSLLKEPAEEVSDDSTPAPPTSTYRWYAATRYNADNTVSSINIYHYDGTGLLLYSQSVSSGSTITTLYEYDSLNRRTKTINSNGITSVYTYNSQGKRDRVRGYDSTGNLTSYSQYLYDSQGRFSGLNQYDASDTLTSHVSIQYDSEGKKVSSRQSDSSDVTLNNFVYSYNEQGLLARKELRDPSDVLISYILYSYEKGPLLEDPLEYFY